MKTYDIVLLTEPRYIETKNVKTFAQNAILEDTLLQTALEKLGLRTTRLSWDDSDFDWNKTRYALFRSTWDYFERFDLFSKWLDHVTNQTELLNTESLIRWNIDKHYLQDLQKEGISCATTLFLEVDNQKTLIEIHEENNWAHTVLKPVVSGTARHTYKLNPENLDDHETLFKRLNEHEPFMLQPFQKSIVEKGEVSMIVIDGKFTHAVLKKVKKGDFRVQDDFGGTVHDYIPDKNEIEFAENVVQVCYPKPIYARVDIFTDNTGQLSVLELELVEPELWFRKNPKAADKLALAIKKLFD